MAQSNLDESETIISSFRQAFSQLLQLQVMLSSSTNTGSNSGGSDGIRAGNKGDKADGGKQTPPQPALQALQAQSSESAVCLWSMEVLLWPLVRRFHFHFNGDRDTAAVDRPEWFILHIINEIKQHAQFLHTHVQPMLVAARKNEEKETKQRGHGSHTHRNHHALGAEVRLNDLDTHPTAIFGS